MPGGYAGSTRSARLPKGWDRIRAAVLARDGHRCTQLEGRQRCPQVAAEVDHIIPGDDHRFVNLRSLCTHHHRAKSSAEGNAGRWRYKQARTPEQHPGLM